MYFGIFTFLFKAVINEDTQGNVRQLQAEVKKLKEQLALLTLGQSVQDTSLSTGNSNFPILFSQKVIIFREIFLNTSSNYFVFLLLKETISTYLEYKNNILLKQSFSECQNNTGHTK